ncbi:hypothetical protein FRX31_024431 [Thalictrum thalictroides]|uniref:Uncharacterized protein n=1 Tax=Thalictrum thalictroides TaxID=46969 RepID=A0A7J6VMJ3_THATH|nr:hypothetical protein FRX31_024431 [Thalictrum thalictroides]
MYLDNVRLVIEPVYAWKQRAEAKSTELGGSQDHSLTSSVIKCPVITSKELLTGGSDLKDMDLEEKCRAASNQ